MTRYLPLLCVLMVAAAPASAGPNAGGTLLLHDPGLAYTDTGLGYCGMGTVPQSCTGMDTRLDGSDPLSPRVWKVYAAFHAQMHPRLRGLVFAIDYDPMVAIVAFGPCAGFEMADSDWPARQSGTSIVFGSTQTAYVTECYWFAGYAEQGGPASFRLIPHPLQGGNFADDDIPSVLDPIFGYGTLGFGTDGSTVCPQPMGACCHPDGTCTTTLQEDCAQWGGPGTLCQPNPCEQPLGACCESDGDCVVTSEAQCWGDWMGQGTGCDPDPCPPPTGACCHTDGSCTVTTEAFCTGTWRGAGTGCVPNPCPQPTGACCFGDGHCEVRNQQSCTVSGGTWQGPGTVCVPNPCPPPPPPPAGACCLEAGQCEVLTHSACDALGGVWEGAGTTCEPNPCPQVGACCLTALGQCLLQTRTQCEANPWAEYLGDGTSCEPNPCEAIPGACCELETGTCAVLTFEECGHLSGPHWFGGPAFPCDPNPCAIGACCQQIVCEVMPQGGCAGTFQGPGTDCDPDPCYTVVGACCFPDGSCRMTSANCPYPWYESSGCDPNPCGGSTPLFGACCLPGGECSMRSIHACTSGHGEFGGAGSSCEPNPCVQPVPVERNSWGKIKQRFR